MRYSRPSRSVAAAPARDYEVEVIPGLEGVARAELRRALRQQVTIQSPRKEGLIPIRYSGQPEALLDLQTVLAVYECQHFAVPRPKALLGQAAFDQLLAWIAAVRALYAPDAFSTFRISAAGAESSVLVRLREELAARTGLEFVPEEGDLLIRLRRPLDGAEGWEILVRLSPRPLSVRPWRVCNLPGALNASVAQAMVQLSLPHPDDVVLNLCCGSATLLIERLAAAPARIAVGCDNDRQARDCGRENVAASSYEQTQITAWDAGALPTPDAWVDVVLVDLPFGQLVGSHNDNVVLYRRLLREATRVTIGGGLLVALTQDLRLWQRLVADAAADWTLDQELPIKLPSGSGHLHPRIFVLRRK